MLIQIDHLELIFNTDKKIQWYTAKLSVRYTPLCEYLVCAVITGQHQILINIRR
jgi:hypothetical protein